MSIILPNTISSREILKNEGLRVLSERGAQKQDIRPLEIVILNLMPDKRKTERQLFRLLGQGDIQVNPTLIRTETYTSTKTPLNYLGQNYKFFSDIKDNKFDGLIVTGAPVETKPFEEVSYWNELSNIFDWSNDNVFSTLGICFGGLAMAHHFHRIDKVVSDRQKFGVYKHWKTDKGVKSELLFKMDDEFNVPVSRYASLNEDHVIDSDLQVLSESDEIGIYIMTDSRERVFVLNHPEYEFDLDAEYERNKLKDPNTPKPVNFYSDGGGISNTWRANGARLYLNWISMIYQNVEY